VASVWIQPKNGKYLVRWYVDDPKAEKSETFAKLGNTKTPGTAKYRERELEEQLAKGTYVDPKLARQKLGAVVDKWISRAHAGSTEDLRQSFRNDLGELAGMSVGDIRAPHVRDWMDVLRNGRPWAKGQTALAPSTVKQRLTQLNTVLNQLVSDEVLMKNHAAGVKAPPVGNAVLPEDLMTLSEAHIILDAADDERLRAMCLVSMKCGLRPGEVAGLRVRDVLLAKGAIAVMQQVDSKHQQTNVLKTPSSRRVVGAPADLIDALKPFMVGKDLDDLLFVTSNGTTYNSADLGGWLKRRTAKSPLRRQYTWKDFRHFYASCLIYHGVNVKTVQQSMGHATATVTLNVYTHLWPNQEETVRIAVEEVWASVA
jgi:integrase